MQPLEAGARTGGEGRSLLNVETSIVRYRYEDVVTDNHDQVKELQIRHSRERQDSGTIEWVE